MTNQEKRLTFRKPENTYRPSYYFDLPLPHAENTESYILDTVSACLSAGCGLLIPRLPDEAILKEQGDLEAVRDMYRILLSSAKEHGLRVAFSLDFSFEKWVIRHSDEQDVGGIGARLLECKEYICRSNEALDRKLHEGELLSLVAYSEAYGEVIDLRPFITDGRLKWTVPLGNWVVREYLCVKEPSCERANYLSSEASSCYIERVFDLFRDVLTPYLGTTLTMLVYRGIGFHGKNRRDWDASFNDLFEKKFGLDAAPLYPALFGYAGKDTLHHKAMLMTVRASMLRHGIIESIERFAKSLGLSTFGPLTEPKLTACSFVSGDAMLCNRYSPCALLDKAYLYGTNSIKIAAGAAYNFDVPVVNGELFRGYNKKDGTALLKDAMSAFARGVNNAAFHLPESLGKNSEFCDFAARVQSMLRGGRHVADIALLYPIYDLHGKVTLYDSPPLGYEYPETSTDSDYMTLINAVSFYAGHDLTVLHPMAINQRCHTEDGVLYLDNQENRESFRIVILPSASIISLKNLRMLQKFYNEGGKLLATGVLPTIAFEYDAEGKNDAEVCRITREIFGEDATNKRVLRRYCYNQNDRGGEAIFLYFNATAVDGTHMTKSSVVNRALHSFKIPFDVYLPGMARFEGTGALNSIYPEFHNVGLDRSFPDGGMFQHIHKSHEYGDVYYFANGTDVDYNHHLLLRGAHDVDEWNPHTGEIRPRKEKFISYLGEIYTDLRLTLPAHTSTLFVTVPIAPPRGEIPVITSIDALESDHAAITSEF
ncbi:MAG: hypothetical protein IKC75_01060 [Clostridia bacterium]|nr:hypothetical protein [Clostridia bacterium]